MANRILNANWQMAERHRLATLPGLITEQQYGFEDLCPCCLNIVTKEKVSLCQNSKALQFLGYGFPLYYIFLKFAIIMMFTLIISYTSIGVYWSYKDNNSYCHAVVEVQEHNVRCSSWMVFFSRTEYTLSAQEVIVRATSFLFQLFLLIYIRDILMKTNHYYDEREISPADFSILVENLPETKNIGSKMKEFLADTTIFHKQFQLVEIIYINQLGNYFHLIEEKSKMINLLKGVLSQKSQKTEVKESYELRVQQRVENVQKIIEQIKREEENQKNNIKNDEVKCQKMIIIVNTEEEKEQLIEDFQKASPFAIEKHFGISKNKLKFTQAPEPREIKWQNINYPTQSLIKRRLLSWFLFFTLLSVVTIMFYFLMSQKSQIIESSSISTASGLVYITLALIIFFNKFVLSSISYRLTDLQKAKTSGQFQFSFAIKYLLGMFFTTAIMTLLVQDLHLHNIISSPFGVVEEESIMFFFSGFLVQIIWIVNPWHIYQEIRINFYKGSELFTQEQANKMMEFPSYSIGKRYAEIVESIWFTYLYSSLIPVGSFLTFTGFVIFYWVDKYNLTRRSSVLSNVSSQICIRALFLLDFTLVMKPFGEIIFDAQIREGTHPLSYCCLALGIVYLCLPMNRILQYLHPEPFQLASKTYRESQKDFPFNYRSLHPLNIKEERAKSIKHLTFKKIVKVQKQEISVKIRQDITENLTSSQLTKIDDRIPQETEIRMNITGENGTSLSKKYNEGEKNMERISKFPQIKEFKKHSSIIYISK